MFSLGLKLIPQDAQMHDGATPLLAAALQGHVQVVWEFQVFEFFWVRFHEINGLFHGDFIQTSTKTKTQDGNMKYPASL